MPFHSPFNLPYLFRPTYKYKYPPQYFIGTNNKDQKFQNYSDQRKKLEDSSNNNQNTVPIESSDVYLFEIFGLKLYIDDIIIMCILFFLYTEGVQDQELFLCLVLLLLS